MGKTTVAVKISELLFDSNVLSFSKNSVCLMEKVTLVV